MNTEQGNTSGQLLQEGDTFAYTFRFSQEEVVRFAALTGDTNPLHLDNIYAASTIFKKPIMHGFLAGSIFTRVFGTMFPGTGTIYQRQQLEFKRPMFVDTNYEAIFTIKSINKTKHQAVVETRIIDAQTRKETITGEAGIMHTHLL
jgi:acyl dehydratase